MAVIVFSVAHFFADLAFRITDIVVAISIQGGGSHARAEILLLRVAVWHTTNAVEGDHVECCFHHVDRTLRIVTNAFGVACFGGLFLR